MPTSTRRETPTVSLAVLMDNARTALATALYAGVQIPALFVSHADHQAVARTKEHETRQGIPLRVLGVPIVARDGLATGEVQLADASELG